jgi:MoxR-like ATPase
MLSVKAGQPLIEFISLCYRSDCPPLLIGHHGVGKSELLKEAARTLDIGYIVRDLSIMEPVDLVGLPKQVDGRTVYLPPKFLPTSGQGILAFEELNRSEKYMKAPCLQLLTARCLNDYVLPPGWLPAAAINPLDQDYDVSELDPALQSRFTQVMVVPDRTEWLAWANRNGIHPSVIAYVEDDDSVFDSPESNPRTWHKISKLLRGAEACDASRDTLRTAILNTVGEKRGAAFMSLLKTGDRTLKAADVLKAYDRHRATVKKWVTHGNIDFVRATLRDVLKHLQPEATYTTVRRSRLQWANLGKFLVDLPGDLQNEANEFLAGRNYDLPTGNTKRRTAA